ncbi:MAG TPA: Fe-S cluster assembly protein SufD [Candidatus Eisenbacteria bacterium]|jgi:FeS assembly protein SufD|nr:Fe-S cluster assembly protein SufD [Candidatus Eisenbacteria bacterium]
MKDLTLKTDWKNSPEPSFKYGLNIFFAPKTIDLAFSDAVEGAPAAVRAPEGVIVMTLAAALEQEACEPLIRELLAADDGREEKITAWHRGLAGNGLLVRVPAGMECATPVRIDLELAERHRVENVIVLAEQGSRVTVVEHLRSAEKRAERSLRSAVTDVIARPGARVTHISLQDFAESVTDFSVKRGQAEADATITWIECVFGGGFAQSRTVTSLAGEGAATGLKTLFFGRDAQRFDMAQEVRHLASHTHSELRTRGALLGTAKTIYRGLIRIEKGTKGCSGKQKEDVLLLSPKAEIDTVPNLEIAADDVRCGHAASVGRIDREKMFYLMSRGLDEPSARKFLVEGFFEPVVEEMRAAGLEDMVQCLIAERTAPLGVQC